MNPLRKRGAGFLLFTLRLMVFIFFMQIAVMALMEGSRAGVLQHKQKTASLYLARSGIVYAGHILKDPRWKDRPRFEISSPDFDGTGRFTIKVERIAVGVYDVTSIGAATAATAQTLTERVRI